MSDKKENGFPSTAFIQPGHPDADPGNGEFVPCPTNQVGYYKAREQQRTGFGITPKAHGVRPGYCERHLRLGCTEEECQ